MKIKYISALLVIVLACSETDPLPPGQIEEPVLILNEGNFSAGNGSIDVYDAATGEVDNSVFSAQATIQTLRAHGGDFYLITNAPDRVDVLSTDFLRVARIDQGLDNPMDFAAIGNRGYVTNWGDI